MKGYKNGDKKKAKKAGKKGATMLKEVTVTAKKPTKKAKPSTGAKKASTPSSSKFNYGQTKDGRYYAIEKKTGNQYFAPKGSGVRSGSSLKKKHNETHAGGYYTTNADSYPMRKGKSPYVRKMKSTRTSAVQSQRRVDARRKSLK